MFLAWFCLILLFSLVFGHVLIYIYNKLTLQWCVSFSCRFVESSGLHFVLTLGIFINLYDFPGGNTKMCNLRCVS